MKCAVGKCKQSNSIKTDVSFYSFPKDPSQRMIWLTFCNRVKPVNADKEKICALHFKEEDFERNLKFEMGFSCRRARKLKPDAVPSIDAVVTKKEIKSECELADECEFLSENETPNNFLEKPVKQNSQTANEIREASLKMYIKNLEMTIDSVRKENRSLKVSKRQSDITIRNLSRQVQKLSYSNDNLNKALRRLFTEGQIKKLKNGGKRQVFTQEDIAESFTLYSASASAYRLLEKKNFPLPSIRTLQRWSQKRYMSTTVSEP